MERLRPPSLLCVATFPSGTGFAWRFIGELWAGLGRAAESRGVRTYVAFPEWRGGEMDNRLTPIHLDATCATLSSVRSTVAFVIRERVRWLYLSDRPAVHWAYPLLRAAGVRRIVVHDHTSGARSVPRGPRRWVKWCLARIPGLAADRVIGVSDFVVRRQIEVGQVPARRVQRIWNGVPDADSVTKVADVRQELGLASSSALVICASRATPEKGIDVLIRAFDLVLREWPGDSELPELVYLGDGPDFERLRMLATGLPSSDRIHLIGYRDAPRPFFASATLCVQPSLWQEAFGLSILEPMSLGCAVIATRVGGIPEIIEDGVSGILIPPDDTGAMAEAIRSLLVDGEVRRRLAAAGRRRAQTHFRITDTIAQVVHAVLESA